MKYYYTTLLFEVLVYTLMLIAVIHVIRNLKNKEIHKGYWGLVFILIPLLIYCIITYFVDLASDLKYAIQRETKSIQGKVEKVYTTGRSNEFILQGKEFRRNPWSFKPKEGEVYILKYLPNSRYVVDYKEIDK